MESLSGENPGLSRTGIPLHSRNVLVLTRDVFCVRREVDLMKTAEVNAYTMHIFGKIEL